MGAVDKNHWPSATEQALCSDAKSLFSKSRESYGGHDDTVSHSILATMPLTNERAVSSDVTQHCGREELHHFLPVPLRGMLPLFSIMTHLVL